MFFNDEQVVKIRDLFRQIQTEIYGLDRADLTAITLVPAETNLKEWIRSYVYKYATEVGYAKFVSDYAEDLPPVAQFLQAKAVEIKTIADSYSFSEAELNEWLAIGTRIDTAEAESARVFIDEKVDETILKGDAEAGFQGLVNNGNVTMYVPAAGSDSGTVLKGRDLAGVTATIQGMINSQKTLAANRVGKATVKADSLLLAPEDYAYIATTPLNANNSTTMLEWLKKTFPQIVNWTEVEELHNASANGDKDRAVLYKKDRKCVAYLLPIPFRQKQAQERALHYKVPCYARCGGTIFKNLKSVIYADGV